MAHFNFVISQNAKWGHAGFYIDRHRMTSSKYAYRKVLFYKKSTGFKPYLKDQLVFFSALTLLVWSYDL